MGGRGASSGVSDKGNSYGSQYHSLLTVGNIKFVSKNSRQSESLMETMTKGRVYVTIGGDEIKSITYFDNDNKRVKEINLDHQHNGMKPHTHHGYFHNENDGEKGATNPTTEEQQMIDRVTQIWENHLNGK